MMRHEQNITLRQGTELTITPRLQQAIALLQLSSAELDTYINEQMLENPLLISMEDALPPGKESSSDDYDADSAFYENTSNRHSDDRELTPLWKAEQTLGEHLMSQIRIAFTDKTKQTIALALMNHLDEDGFLEDSWTHVFHECQLNGHSVTLQNIEEVLSILQRFDPIGIFARTVKETLTIQMKALHAEGNGTPSLWQKDDIDTMMDAFEALKTTPLNKVCKQFSLKEDVFHHFLSHLRQLEFKPAQAFEGSTAITTVLPDIRVSKAVDGELNVSLNPHTVPRVIVNSTYYKDLTQSIRNAEELDYLKEKFASANWLIQSIQKRTVTLLQVASEIVQWQQDFLGDTTGPMKAMTLKDIAQKANVHESTVSRVTTAKYIDTPRGLFELKALFNNTVGVHQNAASSVEIQNALKQLIGEETKTHPLSDEDLVALLESKGLSVARRTVAKYRTALNIPTSAERKRHNKMHLSMCKQNKEYEARKTQDIHNII